MQDPCFILSPSSLQQLKVKPYIILFVCLNCALRLSLQNLKDKMDQGLPLDDDETEDLLKFEQYLLMSQRMKLKDLQAAQRLIGKKKQQQKMYTQCMNSTCFKPRNIGSCYNSTHFANHCIAHLVLGIILPPLPHPVVQRDHHMIWMVIMLRFCYECC